MNRLQFLFDRDIGADSSQQLSVNIEGDGEVLHVARTLRAFLSAMEFSREEIDLLVEEIKGQ